MGLTELSSGEALQSFLEENNACIVTFSAHWCGPCRASKPQLEDMARNSPMPFGYVYESDLGELLHTYGIRAFPTYVCFVATREVQRVQGVNFAAIQQMVQAYSNQVSQVSKIPETGGNALGGGGAGAAPALTPEQARAQRLARLGGGVVASTPAPTATASPTKSAPVAASSAPEPPTPMETTNTEVATETADDKMEVEPVCTPVESNPVDKLDPDAIKTLTGEMGFSLIRAQKGLLYSTGPNKGTVEAAVEWLMQHQEDADIDDPIPPGGGGAKAQSYKCNDCGKILSNMANLELHANKTGHSDFEESTQSVKPLTPEEKLAKINEIKSLLKAKRSEREEAEKAENIEREKQRRFMGKEVAKTREQMEMEQRKRDALARKKEKEESRKERERIRAELEKDKLERKANNGKLRTTLGVEGYNPSAIQYDANGDEVVNPSQPKKPKADASKIDEYIQKVSSYRAGGDGGKCLKILKAYIGNIADNPTEEKFRLINMDNKTFKTKVKPFIGGKHLLLAVGFSPKQDDATFLELKDEPDIQLFQETKEKLEKAIAAF